MATTSESSSTNPDQQPAEDAVSITVRFPPESLNRAFTFPSTSTYVDLLAQLAGDLPAYEWEKSKALVEKKPPSFKKSMLVAKPDASLPLTSLNNATLRFLASKTNTIREATKAQHHAQVRHERLERHERRPIHGFSRPRLRTRTHTFHLLRPLPQYPNPDAAMKLLTRLKNDPGVVAMMEKDKLSVGLLTELDPLSNTSSSHQGVTRLLGLNRNKGEVIELRLRTDDYGGFRDYNSIRKTLCHELAHNTHSEHDSAFWALTRRYELEVEAVNNQGRTIAGPAPRYGYRDAAAAPGPDEDEDVCDHGGWTGGEYVLGGGGPGGEEGAMTRREIRLKAAEARWTKAKTQDQEEEDNEEEDKDNEE
ncbi:DNA-dependent metalloprotease WSS1 [Cladorrhinum sp. PSN332]|nr:DNA-dependent metalloprotease WSS1 [Cladorrhinum sp. PSN332]